MKQLFKHPFANGVLTPLIAGGVLAILAPFGSDEFRIGFRFIYWLGLTLAGGLGAMTVSVWIRKFRPKTSVWIGASLQSLGATAAVAPFVIGLFGYGSLPSTLLTLFYIWIIAIVITCVAELAGRPAGRPAPEKPPALFDRLPTKFRDAQLYAISSEDHYIRIHSEAGEHMLLMRLGDAEDLAAPIKGLKPHRSWWVAEGGVDDIIKSSGKMRIRLKSGTEVPVSREGGKRVRAANWI